MTSWTRAGLEVLLSSKLFNFDICLPVNLADSLPQFFYPAGNEIAKSVKKTCLSATSMKANKAMCTGSCPLKLRDYWQKMSEKDLVRTD